MAFQFTLAAVLRLRESVEEREQRKLEQMQHEIVQTMHTIEQLDAQAANAARTREQAMKQTLPAFHLQAIEDVRRTLKLQKQEMQKRLEALKAASAKQLQVYEVARRDREVLSEMRERQLDDYQASLARQQQKAIDDLFGARHKRK